MGTANERSTSKPDKCETCYRTADCMLTREMAKLCGGPFKDEKARRKFVEENVLERKVKQ